MTATATQTTNLFPYLVAEEQCRDHQAEEALFLTFNVDLGYFEARLLGLLRATGARVTVVADAAMWSPDTRAVKHAGRSYHLGLVDHSKAFHPKLMVLAGPGRAIAAVGSGNLTMSGWQYNRELLTVFTGDHDAMPVAFGNIRDALGTLKVSSRLDPVTSRGLERTIRSLDLLLKAAPAIDTGHRVHASWDGPLIKQLASAPVADLYLSAAFHDPDANAIRCLLERMQPQRVHVAVQPGWTHLDPVALDQVLTKYAAQSGAEIALLQDPESPGTDNPRYRHGKLIEWVTTDGERHAMTGSPNLSTAALLKRAGDDSNYELAVVGPVGTSLFPAGEPIQASTIPNLYGLHDTATSEPTAPLVRVLSALTKHERLTIQLSGSGDAEVTIEVSHRSDHPDQWVALGVVPAGASTGTFDAAVPAGSRVRTNTPDRGPTTPIFVTDELLVRGRMIPEKQGSKIRSSQAGDLFGEDLELLNLIQAELTAFAEDVSNARLPTRLRDNETERAEVDEQRTGDPIEPWLWLQEDTIRRYGPGVASWLLALPRLTSADSATVPWIDIITDEQTAGLRSDEAPMDVDESLTEGEVEATASLIDHASDVDTLKSARRRWSAKATAIAPTLSMPSRLLILRVTFAFWTAGNWSEDDPEPFTLTRDLIRSLKITDLPVELEERTASLAAIAITVMRQRTDVMVGTEQTLRFEEARLAAGPLMEAATEETIDHYVTGLRNVNGGVLTTDHVIDTRSVLFGDDPLAELESVMESKGFDVHRPTPSSMHIHRSGGNAELTALEAVGFAQDHDGIVIWVTTDRGNWACVAWRTPDLVSVFNFGKQERWRHQRLRSARPSAALNALRSALHSDEATSGLPDVVNKPKHRRTGEAAAVLAALGVDSPDEPPCCAGYVESIDVAP